jgi:hypothetical protein
MASNPTSTTLRQRGASTLHLARWCAPETTPSRSSSGYTTLASTSGSATTGDSTNYSSDPPEADAVTHMSFPPLGDYQSDEEEDGQSSDDEDEDEEDDEPRKKPVEHDINQLRQPGGKRDVRHIYDEDHHCKRSDYHVHSPLYFRNDRCSMKRLVSRNRGLNWYEALNPAGHNYRARFHSRFPLPLHCPPAAEEIELCFSLPIALQRLDVFLVELEAKRRIELEIATSRLVNVPVVPLQIEVVEERASLPFEFDLRFTTPPNGGGKIPVEWTTARMLSNVGSAGDPFVRHVVGRDARRVALNERSNLFLADPKVVNSALFSRFIEVNEEDLKREINLTREAGTEYCLVRMPEKTSNTVVMPSLAAFLVVEWWKDHITFCATRKKDSLSVVERDSIVYVRIAYAALDHIRSLIFAIINKSKLVMNLQDKAYATYVPMEKNSGSWGSKAKELKEGIGKTVPECFTDQPIGWNPFLTQRIRITFTRLSANSVSSRGRDTDDIGGGVRMAP